VAKEAREEFANMDTNITSVRSFLDRMLAQGRALAQKGEDAAASRLGVDDTPEARAQFRKTAMASGAAAGLAGLLLGSRRGRGVVRTGAVVGGLGLLGKLAYDAYAKGRETPEPQAPALADLSDEDAALRAETMAWALISAAKADGHIDEAENAAIEAALRDLPLDVRASLTTTLMRPADAAAVARRATSDQERREIYAASVMITGRDHPDEITYLDTLARALDLPADVVAALDAGVARA